MSGDSATKLPALLTPGVYFSVLKLFSYKFLFPLGAVFSCFFLIGNDRDEGYERDWHWLQADKARYLTTAAI